MNGEQNNSGSGVTRSTTSPITWELRQCGHCGAFGRRNDRYCSGCGSPYGNSCSNCGAEIRNSETLYCAVCGNRVQSLKTGA